MNKQRSAGSTSTKVRPHRVLAAKPVKVYQAFTTADAMARWLPPSQMESEAGDTCRMYTVKRLLLPSRTSRWDHCGYWSAVQLPDGAWPQPGGWNRIHLLVDDLAAEVARLRAAEYSFETIF